MIHEYCGVCVRVCVWWGGGGGGGGGEVSTVMSPLGDHPPILQKVVSHFGWG